MPIVLGYVISRKSAEPTAATRKPPMSCETWPRSTLIVVRIRKIVGMSIDAASNG